MFHLNQIQHSPDRKVAFTAIHDQRLLGQHETTAGMTARVMSTRNVRKGLDNLIKGGFIKSMIDVGCGDFNWPSALALRGCNYLGIDIVDEFITANRQRYAAPNIHFEEMDIVAQVPPRVDLVLVRDTFGHFSATDIVA